MLPSLRQRFDHLLPSAATDNEGEIDRRAEIAEMLTTRDPFSADDRRAEENRCRLALLAQLAAAKSIRQS
jgi:hypothetical protein